VIARTVTIGPKAIPNRRRAYVTLRAVKQGAVPWHKQLVVQVLVRPAGRRGLACWQGTRQVTREGILKETRPWPSAWRPAGCSAPPEQEC